MLQHIVNLLKGQVTGRVESGFPERVLNLCAEYGIRFWDLTWESPVAFTFTVSRRDWKRLRRLSARAGCTMTALRWKGTPFFLGRMRRRYALWVGMILCSFLVFLGSFFIWDFEIEGNETVSREEILRALEQHGVGFGTFGFTVDSYYLRNYILLDIPELSYIAVNVKGCRAYVQVREAIPAPEIISRRRPGNTVAAKDALVTAVQPWDGEKMVLPGMVVTEGQLLISGVADTAYDGTRFLRGMGKVYGRTWYQLRCQVPLTAVEKRYTGDETVRRAFLFGKNRINFYFSSSIPGDTYDKIVDWKQWCLPGDVPLPVTTVTETLRAYEPSERERTEEEALALADVILTARLESCLDEGQILRRSLTGETVGDTLLVTLSAECEEQIGKLVEIPKE